jgi:2-iminobutanoate/2-iminopropanoate deaminase
MRPSILTTRVSGLALLFVLASTVGCIGVSTQSGEGPGAQAAGGTGAAEALPLKEILVPGGGEAPLFASVIRSGNLLFLSGVIGRSADGNIEAATRQSLEGVRTRLTQAGATLDDVVKCTVFLIDMADYNGMNRVYAEFFPVNPPARSAVAVLALPVAAQVEVECIAAVR